MCSSDLGIEYHAQYVYHGKLFDERAGREGMTALSQHKDLTAIVTTDDMIAIGVNQYFDQASIDERLSLVGFNNTMLAPYQNPPLSSIDINAKKLGYYASKLLIHSLQNPRQKEQYHIVETELVRRKSYN